MSKRSGWQKEKNIKLWIAGLLYSQYVSNDKIVFYIDLIFVQTVFSESEPLIQTYSLDPISLTTLY